MWNENWIRCGYCGEVGLCDSTSICTDCQERWQAELPPLRDKCIGCNAGACLPGESVCAACFSEREHLLINMMRGIVPERSVGGITYGPDFELDGLLAAYGIDHSFISAVWHGGADNGVYSEVWCARVPYNGHSLSANETIIRRRYWHPDRQGWISECMLPDGSRTISSHFDASRASTALDQAIRFMRSGRGRKKGDAMVFSSPQEFIADALNAGCELLARGEQPTLTALETQLKTSDKYEHSGYDDESIRRFLRTYLGGVKNFRLLLSSACRK